MNFLLEIKAMIILCEPICKFKECIILYVKIKFCMSNSVVIIFIMQFHELEHGSKDTYSSKHFQICLDPENI